MTLDTLNTLTQDQPWMTPQERDLNRQLIRAIASYLAGAGVPENPLVALRVNDVAATWLLARRLESALTPTEGEPAPCPTPAQAGAIGKCRERLRRAMKELEACCPRDAAPARQGLGLIEKMHEAVRVVRASGILDEPAAAGNDDSPDTEGQSQRHHHQAPPNTPHPTHPTHPTHTPQNPSPAENHPNPDPASDPPETRGSTVTPNPPSANPIEPPPPNRATRRRQAREKRRNRTGRSNTAPPTMGTYRRTTPPLERHHRTASTQNEEYGSESQRGGMSRPG